MNEYKGKEDTLHRHRGNGPNFAKREKKVNISVLKEIVIWTVEIIITLILAFTTVYFVGLRISVVGQSMSETLNGGDEVLVNRFIYKVTDPKRGDVVVFLPNGNEKSHYYVKRVIGVPGDTIQIKNGQIYINGEIYEDEFSAERMEDAGLAAEEMTLMDNEYFVLGDNRGNSEDSRYANIGNIKKEYMIGKAWFRYAPWGSMGLIGSGS